MQSGNRGNERISGFLRWRIRTEGLGDSHETTYKIASQPSHLRYYADERRAVPHYRCRDSSHNERASQAVMFRSHRPTHADESAVASYDALHLWLGDTPLLCLPLGCQLLQRVTTLCAAPVPTLVSHPRARRAPGKT